MLNIIVGLMVFIFGYFFLTRRITEIADAISHRAENKQTQMSGSVGLDNAICMFVFWLMSFMVFLGFILINHLNKLPVFFDFLVVLIRLNLQIIVSSSAYIMGLV